MTSPPSATPTGTLRISLPIALGHRQVLPVIESFLESWPAVTAEVSFTDRFVDLVDEGFDIAVRVGEPKPEFRLIARTVATQKLLTWSRLGLGQVKQETLRSALPNNFFDEWILTTASGLNHEHLRTPSETQHYRSYGGKPTQPCLTTSAGVIPGSPPCASVARARGVDDVNIIQRRKHPPYSHDII